MTVATTTGAEIAVIDVRPIGALAVSSGQTHWTEPQEAALAQIGVDKAPFGDQLVLLHHAQRTGLDPFAKQLYLIGRNDRDSPTGKKWAIQTGIDGFRVIARRTADRLGETLEYEDTLWCGDDGQWRDVWLTSTSPAAAKVVIIRNGRRFSAVARFGAYAQTTYQGALTKNWREMGDVMIAKCAEALATRRAFPQDLSGLVTDDEMEHLDNPRAPAGSAVAVPFAASALKAAQERPWEAREEWVGDTLAEIEIADVDQWRSLNERVARAERDGLDGDAVSVLREALRTRVGGLPASQRDLKRMHAALSALGLDDDQRKQAAGNVVGREIASTSELTGAEADTVWRRAASAAEDGGAASLLYVEPDVVEAIPDGAGVSPEEIAAYEAGR